MWRRQRWWTRRRVEGAFANAAEAFASATAMCRDAGDETALTEALTREARIAADQRKWSEAIAFRREALTHARSTYAGGRLAHVVRHLADSLHHAGEYEEAGRLYEDMTRLYDNCPSTSALERTNAVRSVACHDEACGNRDRAITLWRDLRARYASMDDVFRDTYGLSNNPGAEEADRRLAMLSVR